MPDAPVLLAGRYRLGESLGRGGMGHVRLARDETLERDVAIKELDQPFGEDGAASARRTLREARAAARISHPNVVQVYDVLQLDDRTWIVMEYVPSRSLREEIAEQGRLDPYRVARIGLDLLAALRIAHRLGVEHRDVKPANVLLSDDGRVLLTDFGIAAVDDDGVISRSDILVGSPQFMAPERAQGGGGGREADLWSLGATLYAAIEGHAPYQRGSTMATLAALATEEPDPPKYAGPLRPLLDGLLKKDPATRLNVEAAERMLRAILAGLPSTEPSRISRGVARALRPASGRVPRPRAASDPSPAAASLGSAAGEPAASGSGTPVDGHVPGGGVGSDRVSVDVAPDGGTPVDGHVPGSGAGSDRVSVDVAPDGGTPVDGHVPGSGAGSDRASVDVAPDSGTPVDGRTPGSGAGSDRASAGRAVAADAATGQEAVPDDDPRQVDAESEVAAGEAVAGDDAEVSEAVPAAGDGPADAGEPTDGGDVGPDAGSAAAAAGDGPAENRQAGAGAPGGDEERPGSDSATGAGGAAATTTAEDEVSGPRPGTGGDAMTGNAGAGATPIDDAGAGATPIDDAGAGATPIDDAGAGATPTDDAGQVPADDATASDGTDDGAEDATRVDGDRKAAGDGSRGGEPAIFRGAATPGGPGKQRARRRPATMVAAAIAVLLLAGAAWMIASRDGGSPEAGGKGVRATATAGTPEATRAASPSRVQESVPPTQNAQAPAPSPSVSAGSGRPALPPGWEEYTDPTGFSLYVPKGWKRTKERGIVYFRGDGKVLGIDQTDKPKSNPVADWRAQSEYRVGAGDFPNYREVKIEAVDYFRKAADWEFTFDRNGARQHVNNRGTVVRADKAYGFYWQTRDAVWDESRKDLELVFDSFQPAE
ncbi:protein kinase [Actinoplanes sp. NPDC049802]|uniref:serine/threonine-protein kinase n=1 Tax=Actinoplanes sp. NPDC049802 TaxID=3154742 RepID=UPI003407A101